MRKLRPVVALAIAGVVGAGCAYRVETTAHPSTTRPVSVRFDAPLALVGVRSIGWAGEEDAGAAFVQLVAMEFRASGLFPAVFEPALVDEAPDQSLRLSLRVREDYQAHAGDNEVRLIVAAATLLLGSPFVRFERDVETTFEAEARTRSGWRKTYRVETRGRLTYGFYSDEPNAIDQLFGAAISTSFDSLVAQLAEDAELAAALAAPAAGGPGS
jgi:hypothetical protein